MKLSPGILVVASLLLAVPALAQEDEEGPVSIGIGGGMVQTGSDTAPYLTGNVRIRMGYRSAGDEGRGAVSGFVEPEIGYWTRDESGVKDTDLLVGVNIGASVRARSIEYFVGAGIGYHLIDTEIDRIGGTIEDEDNAIGVNAQFGFDVRMTEMVSVYGVGRFDLVDRDATSGDEQGKAYLGLRFRL